MDNEILNEALRLSLEWGKDFESPIQARLLENHPQLTQTQADELETLSRQVQSFSFALYQNVYEKTITREEAEAQMLAKYSFLNKDSLTRLYNQGMYYAWHG